MSNLVVDFERERKNAIDELKGVIGKECSENYSPTHRAKLISYDSVSEMCIMEVVPSPYPAHSFSASNNHRAGERYKAEAWRIWNSFFF